jgi:hypothetical protein
VTQVVAVPRMPEPSRPRADASLAIDVAAGIVGETIGAGMTLLRAASRFPPLRAAWRPPLVPTRLHPASLAEGIAQRGEQHRLAALRGVGQLADRVISTVDLDRVIDRIDAVTLVEEVLAELDLPALVRESTGSLASEGVRTARMTGISADEAISRGLDRFLRRSRQPRASADGAP